MKRYMIFSGPLYYPTGGMDEFLADFDTIEEVLEYMRNDANFLLGRGDWVQVYDTEKREDVTSKIGL